MADLTRSTTQFGAVNDTDPVKRTYISAAAVAALQPVYIDSNGRAALADASVAGTAGVRGLALLKVGALQPVACIKEGAVSGFDLSGLAYDAPVYLSDTAGELADAAGTVSVVVGRVEPMSDSDRTKVLYVNLHAVS